MIASRSLSFQDDKIAIMKQNLDHVRNFILIDVFGIEFRDPIGG